MLNMRKKLMKIRICRMKTKMGVKPLASKTMQATHPATPLLISIKSRYYHTFICNLLDNNNCICV